jgi:hypothetical protein
MSQDQAFDESDVVEGTFYLRLPDIDVQSLGDIEQGDEANRLGISQAM